jgi:hypothetical protein
MYKEMSIVVKDKTKSEVRIVFNAKYRKYIHRLQHRFKDYLNSMSAYDLLNEQEIIRDYILDNKQNIDFTGDPFKIRPHNMQEIFVIMVSIISDVDICGSLTEIVKQKKEIVPDEEYEDYNINMDEDIETHCACGHGVYVGNSPVIFNSYTGKFLLIGCDCALKHEIITKEEEKEIKKKSRGKIARKKREALEEKIRAYQEKQKQKLKQQAFNILKQNLINRKAERSRLNTLVYLTIPAWFKHIAMDSGCKWIQDIKKWCTTTEIYEANEDLQQFKLFNPHV